MNDQGLSLTAIQNLGKEFTKWDDLRLAWNRPLIAYYTILHILVLNMVDVPELVDFDVYDTLADEVAPGTADFHPIIADSETEIRTTEEVVINFLGHEL